MDGRHRNIARPFIRGGVQMNVCKGKNRVFQGKNFGPKIVFWGPGKDIDAELPQKFVVPYNRAL